MTEPTMLEPVGAWPWPLILGSFVCVIIITMVVGLLRPLFKGPTAAVRATFHQTGIDYGLVFAPFVVLGILNVLNGSFPAFLLSPELPVASMVAALLSILTIARALPYARVDARWKVWLMLAVPVLILLLCLVVIAYLVFVDLPSRWWQFYNPLLALLSAFPSFTVAAAMAGSATLNSANMGTGTGHGASATTGAGHTSLTRAQVVRMRIRGWLQIVLSFALLVLGAVLLARTELPIWPLIGVSLLGALIIGLLLTNGEACLKATQR